MDFYGYDRAQALSHCDSLALGRSGGGNDQVRSWNRLRPEHIIELLHGAAAEARAEARTLASLLSRSRWRIHQHGPQSTSDKLVSNVREVALTVGGRDYRLYLTEGRTLQLERISANG